MCDILYCMDLNHGHWRKKEEKYDDFWYGYGEEWENKMITQGELWGSLKKKEESKVISKQLVQKEKETGLDT